ncbi:uncharacterized protein IL334_000237 [Kwoniella shivajii]|uniref:Kelch repeat-containing protein n=1 Tax=Kwoniella shivajii TaxID=564305 RepID=A0ABZ1CPP9_9TREE|nr:hypothetical protein IL334_000237 [Kwoniella shivajii]
MDSNGRHRNPSGSNLTLPNSSTFRRLPTLARSPFRRSEKTSTPPPPPIVDVTPPSSSLGHGGGDSVNHHRGSTFPSLSQVVVDDSSVSSAFFASTSGTTITTSENTPDQGEPSTSSSSSNRLPPPPSRSSSLLHTPEVNQPNQQPPLSPFANTTRSGSYTGSTSSPMITTYPTPSSNESDLEPITYPSHLAQMKPEPAGPAAASSSSSRTITRPRDVSSSSTSVAPVILGPIHQNISSGGPPFGVPRRKESIHGQSEEMSSSYSNPIDRLKDGETDSGTEETVTTKKRTNPRPPVKPRERSLTVPSSGAGGAGGEVDKSRKVSTKISRTAISGKILEPQLPCSRNVSKAPASSMYYSPVPFYGRPPNQALRAHSGTLVGERIWIIGGVDKSSCWRGVAWFDTESLFWSTIDTRGDQFPPLRAHTTTLVGDKLFIFGGGDGPSYSNEVWILDTVTHRFSRPNIGTPKSPIPPPRRAHTTVAYRNYLVVFGGGNGQAALNDVWALDVSDLNNLNWQEWKTKGDIPQKKGYHTANLVGDKMIVFGGSDGHASFADIHILNLKTRVWTLITTEVKHNRLSHTSTQVGSYLFIIGGHNGQTYAQDVLLFNLVTLQWESKSPKGVIPPGRGYHVALLHDARIFISGGYNGESVFDDLWTLDLSAGAYLPQVTTFEVDETAEQARRIFESTNI